MTTARKALETRLGNYIPDEIYVARRPRGTDEIVGWMLPKTEDPKFPDRQNTAHAWAGDNYEPLAFENKFLTDFTMIRQVGRSMSDAVYWRVLHPLGFEFEISLENFEYLLNRYTIDKGLICDHVSGLDGSDMLSVELIVVYNKRNGKWFLVDRDHPEYKKSLNNIIPFSQEHNDLLAQAKADEKAARKKIQVGDTFRYGRETVTYLGTVSVAFPCENIMDTPNVIKRMKVIRSHVSTRNGQEAHYYFLNQLQVHDIKSVNPENYTQESAVHEINHALNNQRSIRHGHLVHLDVPRNATRPVVVWANKPKVITQKINVVDLPAIIGSFVPDMIYNKDNLQSWPKYLAMKIQGRNMYYDDQIVPTVRVRKKSTGELFLPEISSNRYRHTNQVGWQYGKFQVSTNEREITLATYVDHEATIKYGFDARLQRNRYEKQAKANPYDASAQRMLDTLHSYADDQIAAKRAEQADKQWHFNEEYELVHISYE